MGTRTFGGLGIPDIAPIAEAPSPIDSTFAFAPTSTRAFGPGFAPSDAAPELAPDEALGPDAALSPDALVPVEEAPGPAPEPEVCEPFLVALCVCTEMVILSCATCFDRFRRSSSGALCAESVCCL